MIADTNFGKARNKRIFMLRSWVLGFKPKCLQSGPNSVHVNARLFQSSPALRWPVHLQYCCASGIVRQPSSNHPPAHLLASFMWGQHHPCLLQPCDNVHPALTSPATKHKTRTCLHTQSIINHETLSEAQCGEEQSRRRPALAGRT